MSESGKEKELPRKKREQNEYFYLAAPEYSVYHHPRLLFHDGDGMRLFQQSPPTVLCQQRNKAGYLVELPPSTPRETFRHYFNRS